MGLIKYTISNESVETIGTFKNDAQFPTNFAGFDNGFHFTADGKYLYATFPNNEFEPKITSGNLQIMDTATGAVQERYSFPPDTGMPYGIYPNGKDTFKGAFMTTKSQDIRLCDIDTSDKNGDATATVQNCEPAPWLNAGSSPMPVCSDGVLYSIEQNIGGGPGSSQKLTAVNLETGKTNFQVDMASVIPGNFIGAMSCE